MAPQPRPLALWILVTLVVAVVGITALVSTRSLQRVVAAQDALTQTRKFDKSLRTVQVQLLIAETGQREYLLTGRGSHLQPYFGAVEAIRRELGTLDSLARAESVSGPALQQLREVVSTKLQELDHTLGLYGAGQVSEALGLVRSDAGKRAMDAVRAASDALAIAEERRTAERSAEQGFAVRSAAAVLATSLMLNLLLLGTLARRMRANAREARRAHEAMETRNRELAELLESTRARNVYVHALTELSRYLQSALHIDEAALLLQQHLHRLLKADSGALYLAAPSRNQLRIACAWGAGPWVEFLEPTECWALRRGQPLQQAGHGSGAICVHLGCPPDPHTTAANTECLPLVAHGDLVGLLVLASRVSDPRAVDADDLKLQQMTLEQVALCIGNLRLREALRQQSIRDVLTGLYNRRFLEESVQRELLRAQRLRTQGAHPGLALLMVDIDHFKGFNDEHGHEVGDQVLREVAQLLQRGTRGSDVAARHGGEEFVILLPDADAAGALRRAEQLRHDAEQHAVHVNGRAVGSITLSIGVAHFPQHGDTLDRLLQVADKALYDAKHAGRNRVTMGRSASRAADHPARGASPASERLTDTPVPVQCEA